MTAPEPWRERPTPPPPPAYPHDLLTLARDKRREVSEFSWGPGLVPLYANSSPPSEGGMYLPKCPPVELRPNSLTPRQQRRPRGEVRRYPGEQIAP